MLLRRMEKISVTYRVENEVLHKQEKNILYTVERRKANWFSYVLRRSCFLKHYLRKSRIRDRSYGKTRKKV